MSALAFRGGHTERDFNELIAAGVDPDSTQPRDRSVACIECLRATWHQSGGCDDHYRRPAAVDRVLDAARVYAAEQAAALADEIEAEMARVGS